tara:strand:- start:468 stop:587 length:120 start_codon:yes stop_codon:yes gene_type:complete
MKNMNLGNYLLGLAGLAISVYVASMAWSKGSESSEDTNG